MECTNTTVIAIIGGGFCGMMTAVHLMKKSLRPLKLVIVNEGYEFGKGVAYSPHTNAYLLNVRAINMSAYPEDREHFLNWVCAKEEYAAIGKTIVTNIYMPRLVYGEYLADVWNDAIETKNEFLDVQLLNNRAVDIVKNSTHYIVHLQNGISFKTDFVVLATGNSKPRPLQLDVERDAGKELYFSSPWSKNCVTKVSGLKNIFIAGNGLTMIDTVIGLRENGFKGTIHTISPNGFALLPHKYNLLVYEKILEDLPEDYTLKVIFSLVHQHAKRLWNVGIGVHLIVDALRPYTQQIWQSFSMVEKRRFIKMLSPAWNALRHRVPLHIYEDVQNMRIKKEMITYTGRIIAAKENAGSVEIRFFNKETGAESSVIVDRLINCTGPESDITKMNDPLFYNLTAKHMIAPDDLRMGINADSQTGAVISPAGTLNKTMFAVGGSLKGVFWESTAVPELRVQAQKLASTILQTVEEGLHEDNSARLKEIADAFIE